MIWNQSQSTNKDWHHYYLCTKPRCQRFRVDWAHDQIKMLFDKISFTARMVKVYKSQLESLYDRDDVTRKSKIKRTKLDRLKSTKSPFKEYLGKTLRMIENLSQYWDKADGKTKKKILGCIFKEKFEDFNFERCNHIFTPEIESIMLATKVLRKNRNKKEVKNDLLSKMAPPLGLEPRTL